MKLRFIAAIILLQCPFMLPYYLDAQSLEMSSTGGPAGSGPLQSSQVVTLQKNTNNPLGNTFATYTPTQTVTYSFSDAQFASGMFFGAKASNSTTPAADVLYSPVSGDDNVLGSVFTSTKADVIGTGIDASANDAMGLYTSIRPLFTASKSTTGTYYYGKITLAFNNPVNNPVINFSSLGGSFSKFGNFTQLYTTDFVLDDSYSLTLLSSNLNLAVDNSSKKIYNALVPLVALSGASGSVMINGYNISSITFSVFLRGEGAAALFPLGASTWGTNTNNQGDVFSIGVSLEVPFVISGNEFDDANGMNNFQVDGTGTNAGGTNAILVDRITGNVAASSAVSAGGTYAFNNVTFGDYNVMLSTTTPTINATAPSVSLPPGWTSTGEYAPLLLYNLLTNDGFPNSRIPLGIIDFPVSGVNFGIDGIPVSSAQFYTISKPTIGSSITLNGAGPAPGSLNGSDAEDKPSIGSLSGSTIAITAAPANGELWYNGSQITKGADGINPPSASNPFMMTNYDPSKMSIKFTGHSYVFSSFAFSYVDNAGTLSPSSLYTLSWTTPLALQLSQFSVVELNCTAGINFTTADETGLKEINIQYSNDGSEFKTIQNVVLKGSNSNYSFDYAVPPNVGDYHYYQLEIVHLDGSKEYSNILRANNSCGAKNEIAISPNPSSESIQISGMEENIKKEIRLLDINGKCVRSAVTFSAVEKINVSALPSSIYFIEIIKDNKLIATKKIFKK